MCYIAIFIVKGFARLAQKSNKPSSEGRDQDTDRDDSFCVEASSEAEAQRKLAELVQGPSEEDIRTIVADLFGDIEPIDRPE